MNLQELDQIENDLRQIEGYIGADNLMTTLRHGAIPYIPFKSNAVAHSDWEAKSQLGTRMLQFLQSAQSGVLAALSQAFERRNNVPHDQVEVWPTAAQSDAHGADQRSAL